MLVRPRLSAPGLFCILRGSIIALILGQVPAITLLPDVVGSLE